MPAERSRILALFPTAREREALPAVAATRGCEVVFDAASDGDRLDAVVAERDAGHDLAEATLARTWTERAVAALDRHRCHGLTSAVAYPGGLVVAAAAACRGLPATPVAAVLACEHKALTRRVGRRAVPEATPPFAVVDPAELATSAARRRLADRLAEEVGYPLFLKPVKASFSFGSRRIACAAEVVDLARGPAVSASYLGPLRSFLAAHHDELVAADLCDAGDDPAASCGHLLAERALVGRQVSLEGYVDRRRVHVLGVLDCDLFPGTHSFSRFVYPATVPAAVRRQMAAVAGRLLAALGYDHGAFNVELVWDPASEAVGVVEVNAKLASQFTDLFAKVDGESSYAPLLDLALGRTPTWRRGAGPHAVAASFPLRVFADGVVRRVPTESELTALRARHPDLRLEVAVRRGDRLAGGLQDGQSFRYAVLNVGGSSLAELEAVRHEVSALFAFGPCAGGAARKGMAA